MNNLFKNGSCGASMRRLAISSMFMLASFAASAQIKYVAHRGDYPDAPEGSMQAYRNAVSRRSEIVKLDLQETKDNVIVLSHDATFKRTMGWPVKIGDVTLAEAREHVYLFDGKPTTERIVRLDEALPVLKSVPELWLDFKHFKPDFAERVLATCREAGFVPEKLMVATYTKPALAYFQKKHPEIRRVGHMDFPLRDGQWSTSFDASLRCAPATETEAFSPALCAAIVAWARQYGLYGVNMVSSRAITPGLVAALHEQGLWVSLALVHSAEHAKRFRGLGIDAVVTRDRRAVKPVFDSADLSQGTVETPVKGQAPSFLPKGRKFALVWSDEFDGTALDETKWSYRTNFWGRPAHWFAHPSDNTVEVTNGLLRLKVAQRPDGQYVSPQLQTGEIVWDYPDAGNTNKFWWIGKRRPAKFQHRYGYWECRLKFQKKPGWWSAFWMQSENIGTTLDAADSGAEIDMMECFKPGIIAPHNVFARGYGPDQTRYQVGGGWNNKIPNWEGWHVIGVLWNEKGYTFYVDGQEDGVVTDLVSHRPHFLLLTTECRFYRVNRMTGKADPQLAEAVAAQDAFEVDYVRIWDEVDRLRVDGEK